MNDLPISPLSSISEALQKINASIPVFQTPSWLLSTNNYIGIGEGFDKMNKFFQSTQNLVGLGDRFTSKLAALTKLDNIINANSILGGVGMSSSVQNFLLGTGSSLQGVLYSGVKASNFLTALENPIRLSNLQRSLLDKIKSPNSLGSLSSFRSPIDLFSNTETLINDYLRTETLASISASIASSRDPELISEELEAQYAEKIEAFLKFLAQGWRDIKTSDKLKDFKRAVTLLIELTLFVTGIIATHYIEEKLWPDDKRERDIEVMNMVTKAMNTSFSKLEKKLQQDSIEASKKKQLLMLCRCQSTLYCRPKTSSAKAGITYKGTQVEILDSNADWYQVRTSDPEGEYEVYGWVLKKSAKLAKIRSR